METTKFKKNGTYSYMTNLLQLQVARLNINNHFLEQKNENKAKRSKKQEFMKILARALYTICW